MITLDQQIASVRREIGMRERVYPAFVRSGKIKGIIYLTPTAKSAAYE